jgi:hypothetical protein
LHVLETEVTEHVLEQRYEPSEHMLWAGSDLLLDGLVAEHSLSEVEDSDGGVARAAVCHHHNSETRIKLKRFCPSPTALDQLEARYSKGAEL